MLPESTVVTPVTKVIVVVGPVVDVGPIDVVVVVVLSPGPWSNKRLEEKSFL